MKTFSAKPLEVSREWYVVDATDKIVGRLATEIALRLRGKHKPEFTPHVDTGDYIVVINASKMKMSGNKALDKRYFRHTGYPGGIIETTFGKMQERFPGRALEIAVKGMLPHNTIGANALTSVTKIKTTIDDFHNNAYKCNITTVCIENSHNNSNHSCYIYVFIRSDYDAGCRHVFCDC